MALGGYAPGAPPIPPKRMLSRFLFVYSTLVSLLAARHAEIRLCAEKERARQRGTGFDPGGVVQAALFLRRISDQLYCSMLHSHNRNVFPVMRKERRFSSGRPFILGAERGLELACYL